MQQCMTKSIYVQADDGQNTLSQTCSVCTDDFVVDEEIVSLRCTHRFHSVCLIPWLKLHGNCPNCRMLALNTETSPV